MAAVLWSFLWVCGGPVEAEGTDIPASFLYAPSYCLDDRLRCPAEPYLAQPGDIVLTTGRSIFWSCIFAIACTGPPNHSGIVFARPDGSLAILEAGPHEETYVSVEELLPALLEYERCSDRIWVRRRRMPLTPKESAKLTAFALAQEGKGYAILRFGLQITPLRSRGPIRTRFMGKPHGERCKYFCSELVMEACVAAGLLDPAATRPAATYPRDIFFDRSLNPFLKKHGDLSPWWHPPARWTSVPICPAGS